METNTRDYMLGKLRVVVEELHTRVCNKYDLYHFSCRYGENEPILLLYSIHDYTQYIDTTKIVMNKKKLLAKLIIDKCSFDNTYLETYTNAQKLIEQTPEWKKFNQIQIKINKLNKMINDTIDRVNLSSNLICMADECLKLKRVKV